MLQRPLKLDSRPLHDQAITAINRLIESGRFQPGDRLPREAELAEQLGISRSTLREALSQLESHGIVIRRHGVGTFVAAPARSVLAAGLEKLESLRSLAGRGGLDEERVAWEVDPMAAAEALAAALSVQPGSPLVRVQMTAAIEGCPFAYLDSCVPDHFVDFAELAAYPRGSLLDYLTERGRVSPAYTRSEVFAVAAGPHAARLRLAPAAPLLHLAETYYTGEGQPVARSLNFFLTDCFNFHIVRRVAAGGG
jgi:GntR family transcriptional regulator